jgi:hypothetical protein
VTGTTELYTMDSLYLYPVPASDQFLEIHGHLHEYSTQYETLVLDPEATSVEISLEGATAGRFLTVHGQLFAGDKVLLSPDVWQPEAEQPFRYRLKMPGAQYGRLIVGVGAYGFEGYDPSLVDVTQRTTIPYTLRIVTRYGEPPGEYTVFLPLVAYGH